MLTMSKIKIKESIDMIRKIPSNDKFSSFQYWGFVLGKSIEKQENVYLAENTNEANLRSLDGFFYKI